MAELCILGRVLFLEARLSVTLSGGWCVRVVGSPCFLMCAHVRSEPRALLINLTVRPSAAHYPNALCG